METSQKRVGLSDTVIKKDENIIGFSGRFIWCYEIARIHFDSIVTETDEGKKREELSLQKFKEQFELNEEEIKPIRIEQFRKIEDGQTLEGRAYVAINGCKLDEKAKRRAIKRDTIGNALLLEKELFRKLFEKYYKKEIHKEIKLEEYEPKLEIKHDDHTELYYALPEIADFAAVKDRYIDRYKRKDFDYYYMTKMLGGFYRNSVDWGKYFEKNDWFTIPKKLCHDAERDFSKEYFFITNPKMGDKYLLEKKEDSLTDISLTVRDFQIDDVEEGRIKISKKSSKVKLDNEITQKLVFMFFNHFLFTNRRYDNPLNMEYEQLWYLMGDLKRCLPDNSDKEWAEHWVLDRIARDKALNIIDDKLFAMAKKDDDHMEQFKTICNFYLEKEEELKNGDSKEISNELKNLFLTISQNPLTVITGKAGQGKRTLCEKLGEGLKYEGKELRDNRYRVIAATENWEESFSFERRLQDDNRYDVGMLEYLDYEAELNEDRRPTLPYILCINDANVVPVESYLVNFLTLFKKWYRTKDGQPLGNTGYRIPKIFRILLVIDEDNEGILPDEVLRQASVVVVHNPADLVEEINNKKMVLAHYFHDYNPKVGEENFPEEIWGGNESSEERNILSTDGSNNEPKGIYRDLCTRLERNILVNKKRINIHSVRTEHAVSRQWCCEKDLLNNEKNVGNPDQYYPNAVVVDVDSFDENISSEIMALDFALSQRVISYIIHIKGEVTISEPSDIFEFLLKCGLLNCAKLLKDAIDSERITILDELSEKSNNEYIIKKCDRLYENLIKGSIYKEFDLENEKEGLIEQLCKNINYFRDKKKYTRNVIVNMMISLSQGFLTIFSGKPGCGKTSVCRILGGIFGLSDYSENGKVYYMKEQQDIAYKSFEDLRKEPVNPSRYFEVSTERGWTSKRDFIGYYNPLTEQFDKSNAMLYNAFLVMDHQAKMIKENAKTGKDMLPCFILLDEANLSPMEHYWADFMNLCEAWSENNSIDLGGGRGFYLPEALHFIATINNDHTTTVLSPRLIDRATVIDLPERAKGMKEDFESEEPVISPIPWPVLKGVFGFDQDDRTAEREFQTIGEIFPGTEKKPAEIYSEIKEFVKTRFMISISPRTDIAVAKYYLKASNLFKNETYSICKGLLNRISDDREELRQMWEGGSSDEIRNILKYAFSHGNEEVKNSSDEESGEKLEYEQIVCDKEIQALDYAIAQRVLPKITELNSEEALYDMLGLIKKLADYKFFKSAGIVADIADRGYDNGFYNYFR